MLSKRRSVIFSFAGLLLVSAAAHAAEEIIPKADVDRFVQPAVERKWCTGLVVGLFREGETQVVCYGSSGGPAALDGDTVFEIGSISKVFTGTLLADMVERKEVRLEDPVSKFVPASVKPPEFNGKQITLVHLATQHSGLPRMPTNFHPRDAANPYADYTPELLYEAFSSSTLSAEPGAHYAYSNLGVGLLGNALARHAGKSYEELIIARVCEPLQMGSTRVTLDKPMRSRLAAGHNTDGDPVSNWDIPTLAGAGGLRSTCNDMLKFLSAYAGSKQTPLEAQMRFATEPRANVDEANDIGLCWNIDKGRKMPWHNGETGGYHSFVTFDPARHLGVVVLGNTATPLVDRIAVGLTLRLLGRKATPLDLPAEVQLPASELTALCGRYAFSPFFSIEITTRDGRLYGQATRQPRIRLYAQSHDTFFLKAADAKMSFERDAAGNPCKLVLHQNGLDQPAARVPGPPDEQKTSK